MDRWLSIRKKVLVEGASKRQVMTQEQVHWETLKKILKHSQPPGYRMARPRPQPVVGPFLGRIEEILKADKGVHKKQRHTAKRIFERLRAEEGYLGGYTQVKRAVREMGRRTSEVFIPLEHRPGEAQVDFGHALFNVNGTLVMKPFFVMSLPYSGAMFVQVFERESLEFVWEGHIRAFEYFGGVPWRISYDNPKTMVAKFFGVHERELTRGFQQLVSHYLFETHFCTVRRGNEKGVVEGAVKYSRSNFMVPVPRVKKLEDVNGQLVVSCTEDLKRRVRGCEGTKGERLVEDKAHFRPLPATRFDACVKASVITSTESLARFDKNSYSVPCAYAHWPVLVKGYIRQVIIFYKDVEIARHDRLWGKEGYVWDPVHYLAVLEGKPGALDHARPLADWNLPECFADLRRRMEGKEKERGAGTMEYIKTLRLLEDHSLRKLTAAVKKAVGMEIYTRDALAQLLIPQEEWRETTFSLVGHEHLRWVKVAPQDISAYRDLVGLGGAS